MSGNHPVETDRNEVIGDFDAYMPDMDCVHDLIGSQIQRYRALGDDPGAHAEFVRREARVHPTDRVSSIVCRLDGVHLVRYRLGTLELQKDLAAVDATLSLAEYDTERGKISAVFGLIRNDGIPLAIVDVMCEPSPLIQFMFRNPGSEFKSDAMLQALRYLDVPPASGVATQMAAKFDIWRDRDTGEWEIRETRMAVRVTMHRTCSMTHPALEESMDVLVGVDARFDIASTNKLTAYRAKNSYQNLAIERMEMMPHTHARPDFSDWTPGNVLLVKVVGNGMASQSKPDPSPRNDGPRDDVAEHRGFTR